MAVPVVETAEIGEWCARHLGSAPGEILFTAGHLSYVVGARLLDGREVVVKVRQPRPELAACATVHRKLWESGYPCPRPLAGPQPLADGVASAEELLAPGEMLAPTAEGAVAKYAALLADLIRLAPPPAEVGPYPPPPWVHWDRPGPGLWPPPDDVDIDLNADAEPAWIDDVGRAVRDRLAGLDLVPVIGHADWEAQNIRWRDGRPWAVHDWDSIATLPEAALVGHAAAVWTIGSDVGEPDVAHSQDFLDAYQHVARREFSTEEIEVAWAAGLWTRAFNVKKWHRDGYSGLNQAQANQRLRRAGC